MSTISIIGVGTMARALAARALAGGNAVEVIGRDRAKTENAVASLAGATAGEFGATPAGDIVILAVPYAQAASVVGGYGDALAGKVVVDITNPVNPDATGFVTPEGSSGAQEIARSAAPGVSVVKAFNTLFATVLTAAPTADRPVDVFLAGDDDAAKAGVAAVVETMGLRPLDAGPLLMARALENVGLLEIALMTHALHRTDFSLGVGVIS
jgi:8-hydroxy-5-deazaflavin:NADPH oxidoreductase